MQEKEYEMRQGKPFSRAVLLDREKSTVARVVSVAEGKDLRMP